MNAFSMSAHIESCSNFPRPRNSGQQCATESVALPSTSSTALVSLSESTPAETDDEATSSDCTDTTEEDEHFSCHDSSEDIGSKSVEGRNKFRGKLVENQITR